MAKILDPQAVQRMLFEAARDGERKVTGFIGRNDTDLDIYEGLPAGYVWVRIAEQPDPYAAFYTDPASVVLNAPVELDFDVESDAWVVKSIAPSAASYAVTSGGGSSFPFAVPTHDHTDASEGGSLGNNTVDTSQLVNAAVETAKIADEAVTLPKIVRLADGSLFVGNGASADVSELTAGSEGQVLTITSGVPAWEDATTISTPVSVADGGTGRSTLTANNLLYGNGTSAVGLLAPTGANSIPMYTGSILTFTQSPTFGGGLTVNENGASTGDLRVESDTNTHMLFGDASADAIGINTSSPDANSAVTITPDSGDAPLQMTPAATPTNLSNGQVWQDSDRNTIGTRIGGMTSNVNNTFFTQYGQVTVSSASNTTFLTGSAIGTTTLPADFLTVGKSIHVKAMGELSNSGGADSWTIRLFLQSTALMAFVSMTLGATTSYYFDFDGWYTCVATGASSTVRGHSRLTVTETTTTTTYTAQRMSGLASVNTASSAQVYIDGRVGTATAGRQIQINHVIYETLN